jgi:hypothetical protein
MHDPFLEILTATINSCWYFDSHMASFKSCHLPLGLELSTLTRILSFFYAHRVQVDLPFGLLLSPWTMAFWFVGVVVLAFVGAAQGSTPIPRNNFLVSSFNPVVATVILLFCKFLLGSLSSIRTSSTCVLIMYGGMR